MSKYDHRVVCHLNPGDYEQEMTMIVQRPEFGIRSVTRGTRIEANQHARCHSRNFECQCDVEQEFSESYSITDIYRDGKQTHSWESGTV